jgi:RNA polymerase sigma-70 factor (ECF subfamily)
MNSDFNDKFKDELPHLWRFAFRLSRSEDVAEDLVQRAMLRGLEKRHQYVSGTSLRSWLFSIVHSIWKNELRSETIRKNYAFSVSEDEIEQAYTCQAEHSRLLIEVVQQVDRLPEAQRNVLILVCVEGYSYKEAADILDIPVGTVMSRLARARLTVGEAFSTQDNASNEFRVNQDEN